MEIWVNDIRIEMEPCGHCGAVPSERDALQAIQRYREIMGLQICCHCGKDVFPISYELVHTELPDGEVGWYGSPIPRGQDNLWVRGPGGNPAPTAALHRACAKVALPHLARECFEIVVSSPWPGPWPEKSKDKHP